MDKLTIIKPPKGITGINFRELYEYRELAWVLSIKEIKELNAQLEDKNLKKIIYRGVSQNISGSDDFGQSEIDKSQQLTDEDPLKNIKLKQAYDMVDQLGKKCSELIRAQVTKELKYKQIAKEFNMKMGTVMTNLSRCWKKLEELKNAK